MILQHLTSELLRIDDPSGEIVNEETRLSSVSEVLTENDIVILGNINIKKFKYEASLQSRVNLANIEAQLLKAPYYSNGSDLEDFV